MAFEWSAEVDVAVVGGGGCGLAASLAAREHGADVMVVERASRLGGATSLSTGSIPAAFTRWQREAGIEDSSETLALDLLRQAGEGVNEELVRRLAEISSRLVAWLNDDLGIPMELITNYRHCGHTRYRLHAPIGRRGAHLVTGLTHAAERRGINLVTHAPVIRLLVDDSGHVSGIEAKIQDRYEYLKAHATILATNGFSANRGMLKEYAPDVADAPYLGDPGSTGDALRWVHELGGRSVNLGAYLLHGSASPASGTLVSWSVIERGGLLLNSSGVRFADESVGYAAMAGPVHAQDGGGAWLVYDERIHTEILHLEPSYRRVDEISVIKGPFVSVAELSEALKIPSDAAAAAIHSYNVAASGSVDTFGRTDFGLAPLRPPFRAVYVRASLLQTLGGVDIDIHARPVKKDGSIIDRLYVGGGAAVGISGDLGSSGYSSGSGLLAALGWGMIAGDHAGAQSRVR